MLILMEGVQTVDHYHKQFRSLISLTALVSTINHEDGQSAIFKEIQPTMSFDERRLPTRELVLNAIAAILVRDMEVIATVWHDPEPDVGRKASSSGAYQVYAMQNTPCAQEDDPYFPPLPFDGTELMSHVTAVTNPRDDHKYIDPTDQVTRYLMVPQGKSHLGDINVTEVFTQCFKIPSVSIITFQYLIHNRIRHIAPTIHSRTTFPLCRTMLQLAGSSSRIPGRLTYCLAHSTDTL
jgi:hypothetical protein